MRDAILAQRPQAERAENYVRHAERALAVVDAVAFAAFGAYRAMAIALVRLACTARAELTKGGAALGAALCQACAARALELRRLAAAAAKFGNRYHEGEVIGWRALPELC